MKLVIGLHKATGQKGNPDIVDTSKLDQLGGVQIAVLSQGESTDSQARLLVYPRKRMSEMLYDFIQVLVPRHSNVELL